MKKLFLVATLLCGLISTALAQRSPSVKGMVANDNGQPLEGVTVRALNKSTQQEKMTVSDSLGKFSFISLPDGGYTFFFSSVNYQEQQLSNYQVKEGKTVSLLVKMSTAYNKMNEVVVVAYGTQKRKEVTGAISSVGRGELKDQPVSSFTEAIAGQIPGVQVQLNTGEPGAALNVRVRGAGSVTANNNPLYVLDGFPLAAENLSNLNTSDIVSIEVLKDASATAIYGSRGSNGVVMITTRRGANAMPRVNFTMNQGIQQVTKKVDVLSPEEYVDFALDATNYSWVQKGGKADDPNSVRQPLYQIAPYFLSPDQWTYTNWQDQIFRSAPMADYNLNVSGGNDNLRYMLAGGYFDQKGIIHNTHYQRYSARVNLDGKISPRVKWAFTMNPNYSVSDKALSSGRWSTGAVGSALALPGFFPVQNADGTYPSFAGFGYNTSNGGNPVQLLNQTDGTDNTLRLITNGNVQVSLLKNLVYKINAGIDYNNFKSSFYKSTALPSISDLQPGGSYSASDNMNWLVENTLEYNWEKGEHRVNVLGGQSAQKNFLKEAYIEGNSYPNDLVKTLNASQITSAGTREEEWALTSYFARINYAFRDKYYVSAAIRTDGSSRFGASKKWGRFPSISAGWRISDEVFMKNIHAVNELKLRVSHGLTGNNFIPNYGAIGLLRNSNYVFGAGNGSLVSSLNPSTTGNPNLSWENATQTNLGLDLGLFANRVYLSVDYYNKINANLLLDVPVPSIMGVTTSLQNIGEVKNYGMEFALTTRNLVGDFSWTTTANLSFNRNKVMKLGPNGDPILQTSAAGSSATHITMIGKPIGSFYGFIFEGVYNTVEEINSRAHLSTDKPGDPIIRDVLADGKITMDDRTIIGNPYPDYTFGLDNHFKYKSFDLRVLVYGVQGNEILNLSKYFTGSMTGRLNALGEARDRWRSPEEPGNGKLFRASLDIAGYRRMPSTYYVEDASFVRLKNITLGYTVPAGLLRSIHVADARIFLSVQNLHTWTNYQMYNPEATMNQYNSQLTPGVDQDIFPLSKTFTAGINLTF
ncbi:MAG: TonB-dependent receptor [Candidatus Pseudobacter hemicellulosilyticus]|uniref:TonB-dependent receptor n=1 Tax=Candidatus Pseudobacter hemicellulosilyticus TaxID=3121375 RepID=A0AAJ5WN07_9BACT|nr:MAG: TonB-dependent receptor [Pseudobacter sp.]